MTVKELLQILSEEGNSLVSVDDPPDGYHYEVFEHIMGKPDRYVGGGRTAEDALRDAFDRKMR